MKFLHKVMIITVVFVIWPVTTDANEGSWSVDKSHSRVGFSVTHLGINTVHGAFSRYDATVKADDSGRISAVSASIQVASINTGIEKRDNHLREPDIFNVAKYPTLEMKTKHIHWKGNRFTGTASLTIKGKTLPVKFKGTLNGTKKITENGKQVLRVGYKVQTQIDRKKFGLKFGVMSEGLGMVSREVQINLNVELTRAL